MALVLIEYWKYFNINSKYRSVDFLLQWTLDDLQKNVEQMRQRKKNEDSKLMVSTKVTIPKIDPPASP